MTEIDGREALREVDPMAMQALKNNQRQLDMDGVEVGVSRQALDMLIEAYDAIAATVEALEKRVIVAEENDKCSREFLAITDARIEALEKERNLFKAKDASKSKLLERFRDQLRNMCDHFEDEGDRIYFGSTNDADELKDISQQMDGWKWDAIMGQTTSDPYADLREQRSRAEAAEARVSQLEAALEYIADKDPSYLVAPTEPPPMGYPGHLAGVARTALGRT